MDRDADDINKNKAPQDPPREFQATEEAEQDPVILYPNIFLGVNHETPTEQVQVPEEPPEDTITSAVQPPMTTEDTNRPDHPSSEVRIYPRVRTHTNSYTPSMSGNRYSYATEQMA